jgi:SAM-dependent methyltransferase
MIAHIKDNAYWDNYYKNHQHAEEISKPSNFAIFCNIKIDEMFNGKSVDLLEIGCGNGRDSEHFALNHKVVACDLSQVSIDELNNQNTKVNYCCADFTNLDTHDTFDVIYSRFTLHSVDGEGELRTIQKAHEILNEGGLFMIETRSNYDEICGRGEKISDYEWVYDGHYRRFNVLEDFLARVKSCGFEPVYVIQSKDLAPFGDRNPVVIRTILRKSHS